jgi:hypothetical protein
LAAGGIGRCEEFSGSYEIVALDRAEFPRYDGGWNPGSGAEVEFSGWKFFREGEELSWTDQDVFSTPAGDSAPCGGLDGAEKFFLIKSKGTVPSYAQRTLNQKIWKDDMFSVTMILPVSEGRAGMVVGRIQEGGEITGAVALVRENDRYLLLDGEGELDVGIKAGGCPIGASFVFTSDGTYTLQVNEMTDGGMIVDIGPRKPRLGGVPSVHTVSFFAEGGAECGFNDLQVERLVE